MNPELKTTEYIATLKSIKLSDSARTRIADNLQAYATFHTVRVGEENRLIKQGPVTTSTSLLSLRFTFMPLLIILAVIIGGSTTFAAQNALPGDFLYPVKIEFNENIRTAFAFSADSVARVHTDLLEERIEEAQILYTKGRLTDKTATEILITIDNQLALSTKASAKSSASVAAENNTRVKKAMSTFLAFKGNDTTVTASNTLQASDLATELYAITAYQKDMKLRTMALKNLLKKYQAKLDTSTYAELNTKISSATTFTIETDTQTEAEARTTLDKAATLAGEVESKLSTLGQVVIDPETGLIIEIDFSIDPLKINLLDEEPQSQTAPSTHKNKNSEGGVKSENSLDTTIRTDVVETPIESDASVSSEVGVEY